MKTIGEPMSNARAYSPVFVTARWNKQLLEKLDIIDNMLANGKLKNQKDKKRAAAGGHQDKFQSLGSTYVTALNGLPDEMIMAHLMKVITKVEERVHDVNGVPTTWGFDLAMNRVFLPSQEFRGSDEKPGEDLGFTETSKTEIHIFHADVCDTSQVHMTGNFKLVLLDPPYGVLKDEVWDVKWEPLMFRSCLENVLNYNSAEAFTFISFCSAEQISGFLEVLTSLQSETLQVGVTHGAWYKVEHHQARKNHKLLRNPNAYITHYIFALTLF